MAGCSSDLTRFADSSADPTPVASIPSAGQGARQGGDQGFGAGGVSRPSKISSTPLAAPNPRFAAAATPSPSLNRPIEPSPASTAAVTSRGGSGSWSAEGGTPIVVAQGESVGMLSTRYGVPAEALLHANGFTSASQVQPGARLVIPVYSGAGGARHAEAAPRHETTRPTERVAETAPRHEPAPREKARIEPARTAASHATEKEKLHFAAGPSGKPERAETASRQDKREVAKADSHATRPAAAAVAEKQTHAEKRVADKAPAVEKPARQTATRNATKAEAKEQTAQAQKAPVIDRDTPTGSVPPVEAQSAVVASAASDKPEFRWPARGRVIQGFKPGGNDGINIALPEGTAVKAAEGGVVAYAGNELKGYGNLVLIRHPNGFVTAYANNGEIDVKRGEQVKRGQTIAKSGQTGNVASPQLHFELRKGSTPVDPTNFLAGL